MPAFLALIVESDSRVGRRMALLMIALLGVAMSREVSTGLAEEGPLRTPVRDERQPRETLARGDQFLAETIATDGDEEPTRVVENADGRLASIPAQAPPPQTPKAETPPMQWTPEQTLLVARVGAVQVSPDATRVAYTVRKAVMNDHQSHYLTHIYLADSVERNEATGRNERQLTRGDHSCDDPQWSPDGRWLAFLSDRPTPTTGATSAAVATSERKPKKNLWVLSLDGGDASPLTDAPGGVSGYRWSPDGRALAFVALDGPTPAEEQAAKAKNDARVVDENVKHLRLYAIPFSGPPASPASPRLLTPGDYSVSTEGSRPGRAAFDWSPDGQSLVFSQVRTPSPDHWTTADVARVELATGQVAPLIRSNAAEQSPLYSPDGEWIAVVVSDDPPTWAGAGRVHLVPARGGESRVLAVTHDGFGRYSELIGWSADSRQIYLTEVHGVDLRIVSLPIDGGAPRIVSHVPGMGLSGVLMNPTRSHVGWSWETTDQASEAWTSSLNQFTPTQISRVNAVLPPLPLGRTDVARWKSTDGLDVEGLLTLPVGYEAGRRYPLLVVIHGGPMGVFTRTYIGSAGTYPVAVFAAQGYVVLRPNPRGSSGYGQSFRHANRGDWGGGDYRDIMSGVDHLIAQGIADPDRMGVMGWSYGGFMTSWIISQNQRFRCASVGAGVTNLMSFTGTADIPGFLPDYFDGEFWDKPRAYANHSAMFRIKGVTTPTLIQHGEKDERVPLSQGMELYNALKRQGCPTRMVIYPRTPHAIEEPRLLLDAMQANVAWFQQYIPRK